MTTTIKNIETNIRTVEYSRDLHGVVITLSNEKVAHAQWNKETNRLHADFGEERLERYTEWDSEDLTQQEQDLVDEYVHAHEWTNREIFQ